MIDQRIKNLRFVVISLLVVSAFAALALGDLSEQRAIARALLPLAVVRSLLDSGEIDRWLARTAQDTEKGAEDPRYKLVGHMTANADGFQNLFFPIVSFQTRNHSTIGESCNLPEIEFKSPPLHGYIIDLELGPYNLSLQETLSLNRPGPQQSSADEKTAASLRLEQEKFGLQIHNHLAWSASCKSGQVRRTYQIKVIDAESSKPKENLTFVNGVSVQERNKLGKLLPQIGVVDATASAAYATVAARLDHNRVRLPILNLDLRNKEIFLAITTLAAALSMWGGHLLRRLADSPMANRNEPWLLVDTLVSAIAHESQSRTARTVDFLEAFVVHSGHVAAMLTPIWLFWLYLDSSSLDIPIAALLTLCAVFSLVMFGAYLRLALKVAEETLYREPKARLGNEK